MNQLKTVRPGAWALLGLSLLLLLLGLAGRGVRSDAERLARLQDQQLTLQRMIDHVAAEQNWLDGVLTRGLEAPEGLIAAYAPEASVFVRDQEETVLTHAIRLRRFALTVEAGSWETVRLLIETLERQMPPWRLTAMELSSELTGLEGTLWFEGLEPF